MMPKWTISGVLITLLIIFFLAKTGRCDLQAGMVPVKDLLLRFGNNGTFKAADFSQKETIVRKKVNKKKEEVDFGSDSASSESRSIEINRHSSERYRGVSRIGSKHDICTLPKERGNCADKRRRWHYNGRSEKCRPFTYSGCGGNRNNFISKKTCTEACKGGLKYSKEESSSKE